MYMYAYLCSDADIAIFGMATRHTGDSFPMFTPSNHVKLQIFLKLMMTCFELTELCTAVH